MARAAELATQGSGSRARNVWLGQQSSQRRAQAAELAAHGSGSRAVAQYPFVGHVVGEFIDTKRQ